MRKLRTWLALATAAGLATAGVAVATHKQERTHTDSVSATFTATPSSVRTKNCAGSDSAAYRAFHGSWSGTSTGDPRLTGTFKLRAHGLINTTTDRGQVTGHVRIHGPNGKLAHGSLAAVYRAGKIHGAVVGRVKDRSTGGTEEDSGSGRLIGLVESTFALEGLLAGRIGGSEATILPANIQHGGCGNRGKGHGKRKHR